MVAFVILHYKTIDETLFSLKCLKNTFKENEYKAIVVDNHTLESAEIKKIKEYTEDIILLDENIGFAKANNEGALYAIKKYQPEFIAIINNDVFIEQKDFIKIIKSDYTKYHFDVLGPWIDSTTGESCNPFPVIYGKDKIIEKINYTEKLIKIYKSAILYTLLQVFLKIKHLLVKPITPKNAYQLAENVPLHGCALIFSKKYYANYQEIFCPETFLFHEEEFLYDRIIKDKLTSIYDPNLKVFHKEGTSIKKTGSKRLSKLFKEEEKLKSLKKLLNRM